MGGVRASAVLGHLLRLLPGRSALLFGRGLSGCSPLLGGEGSAARSHAVLSGSVE